MSGPPHSALPFTSRSTSIAYLQSRIARVRLTSDCLIRPTIEHETFRCQADSSSIDFRGGAKLTLYLDPWARFRQAIRQAPQRQSCGVSLRRGSSVGARLRHSARSGSGRASHDFLIHRQHCKRRRNNGRALDRHLACRSRRNACTSRGRRIAKGHTLPAQLTPCKR